MTCPSDTIFQESRDIACIFLRESLEALATMSKIVANPMEKDDVVRWDQSVQPRPSRIQRRGDGSAEAIANDDFLRPGSIV